MPHRRSTPDAPVRFRKLTIPLRAHPLVRRLYREMNRHEIGPREVERRAGLGHKVINEWRTGRKPDIDCITAALNVVGLRLCVRETDFVDGREIVPVKCKVTTRPVEDTGVEIIC